MRCPFLPAAAIARERPRARRRATRALLIAMAVALGALAARAPLAAALDLDLGSPHLRSGDVYVAFRVTDLFAPRVEESLGRGMPATLIVTAELWQHRTAWFDRLAGRANVAFRIQYDVWTRSYRIERQGLPEESASTLDSVALALSRPVDVPLTTRDRLSVGARYYVVVSATLKPLSVEDVEEGEGWLSGEVVDKRHAGLGVLTAIPRSLFDAVRNLAGLGDQRVRSISDDFKVGDLPER